MENNEWTGCAHCGQTLPHEGTGWRESSRCRLFQRIAEQAWNEGRLAERRDWELLWDLSTPDEDRQPLPNPYCA